MTTIATSQTTAAALRGTVTLGGRLFGIRFAFCAAAQAVRDELHHVQPLDILAAEQVNGMALLLAEDGHQHVDRADFLLAAGLHMEHGPLQHALKAQRGLHFALVAGGQPRRLAVDVLPELVGQPLQLGAEIGRASCRERV